MSGAARASRHRLRALPPFTVKGKARVVHAVDVGPVVQETGVWRGADGPLGHEIGPVDAVLLAVKAWQALSTLGGSA